jgi:transglutaminase superfamily protein
MSTLPIPVQGSFSHSRTFQIDDGDAGTAQTVALMYPLIYQGSKDEEVNRQAIDILGSARVRDWDFAGQRRAIFQWVARNIHFVRDVAGVETLRTARETLERRYGDCDCQTILMGALLATIGNHVRITTVESQPGNPEFSHVFLEVMESNGRWVPADSARPGARYGRGPEQYRRRYAWPNPYDPGPELGRVAGLNGYGLAQSAKEVHQSYAPMQVQRLHGFGRLRGRRLGQDGIDWSGIAATIQAGGNAATGIIAANQIRPGLPYTYPPGYSPYGAASPYGAGIPIGSTAPPGYIDIAGTLVSTSTVLIAGGLLFALVMFRRG